MTESGRVLLVEDHARLREAVAELLTEHGYDVLVAAEGAMGWQLYQRHHPEVVVSDWLMPQTEIDGLELLRRIRSEASGHRPHFILLTARGEAEERVEGLETGADDYLVKPFDERELLARISVGMRRVLDSQAHERSIRESLQTLEAALPSPATRFSGIQWGYLLRPCEYVGGDSLDLFESPTGHLIAVHYDVTGHGIPAAIASVTIHTMLRSSACWQGLPDASPAALVERLNQELSLERNGTLFTMFCAVIDADRSAMRFTRAGHPPPILLRQGEVRMLRTGGPLVGLQGMKWKEQAVPLQSGDRLLMYSDGLIEATARSEQQFERRRLGTVAAATASLPIPDALQQIDDAVRRFTALSHFADDVSLFALDVQ